MRIPVINVVETGENIRRYREMAGVSVNDLRKILKVSPTCIYKWQRGAGMPAIDNLVVLASVLNVKVDDILVADMVDME